MRQGEIRIEPGATAPRLAREELGAAIGPIDPRRKLELEVAISELVTNALLHDDPREIALRWSAERSVARIEIPTGEPGIQEHPERWGWGLKLVDRIASRWAVQDGPVTWFEVEIRPRKRVGLEHEDESTLFARAAQDEAARDELFSRYLSLALSIARRFRGKGVDDADLDQAASLALVKAMNRFDPELGSFAAYASRTVSGELKRYLRDRGWSVRVPRSLKEAALEVGKASQLLSQRLGRTPTIEEISREVDRPVDEVVEALQAGTAYRAGSLDAPAGGDEEGLSLLDRMGETDDSLRLADRWQDIAGAIEALPERERRILYLRFYEDMTQTQIAEIIGISQMHVSRLLSRSIARLRELTEA